MATTVVNLDGKFKSTFGITEVHWNKDGGQKHVYLVTRKEESCILKVYKNFNKRDIREIKIYEKFISLPDIPKLIEVRKYGKDTISFEKFIEGKCLEDILKSYKENPALIAKLLSGICNVMKPLWESKEKIVHRDIKPSNLIIKPDGKPCVIDFGIAKNRLATKVTHTGFQPNSWPYAAPEQYRGSNDISYRTDFFSIGALGYHLYHGKLAYGNTQEKIAKNFDNPKHLLAYSKDCPLNQFFQESLNVSIAERPRTPDDMIKLLTI